MVIYKNNINTNYTKLKRKCTVFWHYACVWLCKSEQKNGKNVKTFKCLLYESYCTFIIILNPRKGGIANILSSFTGMC